MGYSTTTISTAEAQQVIRNGIEINEATNQFDLGTQTLKLLKGNIIWESVSECELGDNDRLYITFQNGDFVVVDLKPSIDVLIDGMFTSEGR